MNTNELEHILDQSFRSEPDFHLPADFARQVTQTVVRREQWKTDLFEYLYLSCVLVFLLAVVSGLYYFIDKQLVLNVLTYLSGNVIQVALILFILNFILFADRVLLRLLFRSLPHPLQRSGERVGIL